MSSVKTTTMFGGFWAMPGVPENRMIASTNAAYRHQLRESRRRMPDVAAVDVADVEAVELERVDVKAVALHCIMVIGDGYHSVAVGV